MKKFIVLFFVFMFVAISNCYAQMSTQEMHETMLYPVIRVNEGGSGTIIYSLPNEDGFSTYALTNHHVIDNAIQIVTEWDSNLQKEIKKEKRKIIYCEIFKYKNLSDPIGTLKVESNIVLYNEDEDMALVKLSLEEPVKYVAALMPREDMKNLHVMDKTCAVGCSLGWPPIPTWGVITRKNVQINSLPYHMSSSQIIFGNSGGAIYKIRSEENKIRLNGSEPVYIHVARFIGIPSMVPVTWNSGAITHMGLFVPADRIYDWLEDEHYEFIFDESKTEAECLAEREKALDDELKKSD